MDDCDDGADNWWQHWSETTSRVALSIMAWKSIRGPGCAPLAFAMRHKGESMYPSFCIVSNKAARPLRLLGSRFSGTISIHAADYSLSIANRSLHHCSFDLEI